MFTPQVWVPTNVAKTITETANTVSHCDTFGALWKLCCFATLNVSQKDSKNLYHKWSVLDTDFVQAKKHHPTPSK